MKDDDKALVKRLRERGPNGGLFCDWGDRAADRIEALTAEIERLREALWNIAHHTSVRTAQECWEEARAALGGEE